MNDYITAPVYHTENHSYVYSVTFYGSDVIGKISYWGPALKETHLRPSGIPGFLIMPAVLINSSCS